MWQVLFQQMLLLKTLFMHFWIVHIQLKYCRAQPKQSSNMLHLSLQHTHLVATFNAQALDCCHLAYVTKHPVCQHILLLYL